ncbi:DNA adenine methylase [Methanococcoides methylutens]|uniref:site-specific DNA-methyltransferase (adenine-specific) n=1 Tax=Methanococcoides methylutens MM1 TaxID=1434104 RepID=A0A0E3X0K6_METMT|nr:DNA adenine methylase [Methanococcoides methylutens]AKB85989.1 Cytosine-specific DNA methyltransferase [Methanococcoides methylutens MM1]
MNLKVKTALRYPGGKSKALSKIFPYIPNDFLEFREPFVGGGSVFIAAKQQAAQDSLFRINDLNYDLFCFWKQLRDNDTELINEISRIKKETIDGKLLHSELMNQHLDKSSELEIAVRFFVLNRITFSGLSYSGGYSQESFEKRFTKSSIDRLTPLSELIQDIKITNKNYEYLLNKDGDDVFIFLDPPYFNARESKLYGKKGHLHTSFNHKHFARIMKKCTDHKWLITCDDSPEIRDLFDFANILEWNLQYGVNHGKKMNENGEKKAKKGKELFIFNYELDSI